MSHPPPEWPPQEIESLLSCPVCDSPRRHILHTELTDRVFFCAPGRWTLKTCEDCGSAYLDPRPTPASIGLAYSRYFTHDRLPTRLGGSSRLRRLVLGVRNDYFNARYGYSFAPALPIGRWLVPLLPIKRANADRDIRRLPLRPGGRLLDVGCGNGAFIQWLRAQGWGVEGIESDPLAVAEAHRAGLSVRQGTLTGASYPEASFDAITLNHVIEHLHAPLAVLKACRRLLKPGGRLWIATPNLASPLHLRFGANWYPLDPPRHLVLFTPGSLRLACERAGFRVRSLEGSPDEAMIVERSLALSEGRDPHKRRASGWGSRWLSSRASWASLWRPERRGELAVQAEPA